MLNLFSKYKKVVFIDAHTGEIEEEIRYENIATGNEAFTFHTSFFSLVLPCVAKSITGYAPDAWLFQFEDINLGLRKNFQNKHLIWLTKQSNCL